MKIKPVTKIIAVLVFVLCFSPLYLALAATIMPPKTGGFTISLPKKDLVPFDIVTIKGKFDTTGAVSVIFTLANGQKMTIPATKLTATTLKVQIPPVGYSEAKAAFSRQKVSLKVIQIKEQGKSLVVKTSNTLKNYYIAVPLSPAFLKKAAYKKLPKGTLTRVFVASAIGSLKTAKRSSLASSSPVLSASLTKAEQGMKDLLADVTTIVNDQKAITYLQTVSGTPVNMDLKMLKQSDAFFAAYLGVLGKYKILAQNNSSANDVHIAQAVIPTACEQEGWGDLNISDAEKQLYADAVCTHVNSTDVVLPKANTALEMGLEIVWSTPSTLGALEYAALGSPIGNPSWLYKNIIELEAALIWAMHDEWLLPFHEAVVEPVLVNAHALHDNLFGTDPLTQLGYMAETLDETGKELYNRFTDPNNAPGAEFFAIMADPFYDIPNGFNSDMSLFKLDYGVSDYSTKNTSYLRSFKTPADSQSLILDSSGIVTNAFDIVYDSTHKNQLSGPTCGQLKQVAQKDCNAACGSSQNCYTDYSACTLGCEGTGNLLTKSNCINNCLGALSKCTGASAKCASDCLKGDYASACP